MDVFDGFLKYHDDALIIVKAISYEDYNSVYISTAVQRHQRLYMLKATDRFWFYNNSN